MINLKTSMPVKLKKPCYDFFLFSLLVSMVFLTSCDVADSENEPTGEETPYFSYQIKENQAVMVNCEKINFIAESGGDYVQPIFAASASTNSTFSYAFYGSAEIIDTLSTGEYPIIPYTGWASQIPMHFSLKVPRTKGGNDFYLTINSDSPEHKHLIDLIEKKGLENGMRVYFVQGSYNLQAKNVVDSDTVNISGKYFFKLLTIEE
ncbi:MAG: hypothetical protein K9J16_12065 [Melioribacteraceae bacterium]|nr:hypothetical protein [Melioribacteraceae bacterium]MCF8393378.1 hypothetical protein [Melioribacteraceae bacterium]MCF8418943.1 hypothetical protein [Melioribacteraceae bacterium]